MASVRQVQANRRNGLKGGVKTEEGKAVSRLNARKHSIFASALTTEDSEEAYAIEDELIVSLRPVGRVEGMLVEKLALTYLRMQRCARAEAEYHIQTWEEPNKIREPYQWQRLQEQRRDGARGVVFDEKVFERMVKLIDLYDARLTNQFLKLIHEIERLQLLRKADPDAAAPQGKEEPGAVAAERATDAAPQPESASPAPSPAVTQTSCPPSQPPVEQPSQPRAPVPHTPQEETPALAFEKSQDAGGQEDNAHKAI
jgi:hypothetical protein